MMNVKSLLKHYVHDALTTSPSIVKRHDGDVIRTKALYTKAYPKISLLSDINANYLYVILSCVNVGTIYSKKFQFFYHALLGLRAAL